MCTQTEARFRIKKFEIYTYRNIYVYRKIFKIGQKEYATVFRLGPCSHVLVNPPSYDATYGNTYGFGKGVSIILDICC